MSLTQTAQILIFALGILFAVSIAEAQDEYRRKVSPEASNMAELGQAQDRRNEPGAMSGMSIDVSRRKTTAQNITSSCELVSLLCKSESGDLECPLTC